MKPSMSFIFLSLSFLALVVMAIVGNIPYWGWYVPVGVGIMATMTIFQGLYLPQKIVDRGIALIQSQDYNNRLVKVGEKNADRIVELFNSLIDKLRAERLQNREQESLLKLLIEASPMGVVMLDFNHDVSMANHSFLKFFGIKDLTGIIGKKLKEISSNETDKDLVDEMIKVPLGKSEIIRKGNNRIFRIYHLNFVQEGFRREFFLLESLTEEIMKAEKAAYEKVIRTISHEVNNTMGGVRSVLETVGEQTDDDDIRKVVESCNHRCERLGEFIREYAEVVKIPDPVMIPIKLKNEIDSLLPFLQRLLPTNVALRYKSEIGQQEIKADVALLQQVIVNIFKNAIDSIKGNGWIELNLSKSKNHVSLIISNNGLPIEEENSSRLFTPFFTTKPEGKGIGLTLVREILNLHSAEYSLSTGLDGITRFIILFNDSKN